MANEEQIAVANLLKFKTRPQLPCYSPHDTLFEDYFTNDITRFLLKLLNHDQLADFVQFIDTYPDKLPDPVNIKGLNVSPKRLYELRRDKKNEHKNKWKQEKNVVYNKLKDLELYNERLDEKRIVTIEYLRLKGLKASLEHIHKFNNDQLIEVINDHKHLHDIEGRPDYDSCGDDVLEILKQLEEWKSNNNKLYAKLKNFKLL